MPPKKEHRCPRCNRQFAGASNLRIHIRTIHDKIKAFKCDVCSRAFAQKATLENHIRTHTKERPFPCHQCGKRFGHRATLANHLNTHLTVKPYPCEQCGRRFARNSNLKRHAKLIHKIDLPPIERSRRRRRRRNKTQEQSSNAMIQEMASTSEPNETLGVVMPPAQSLAMFPQLPPSVGAAQESDQESDFPISPAAVQATHVQVPAHNMMSAPLPMQSIASAVAAANPTGFNPAFHMQIPHVMHSGLKRRAWVPAGARKFTIVNQAKNEPPVVDSNTLRELLLEAAKSQLPPQQLIDIEECQRNPSKCRRCVLWPLCPHYKDVVGAKLVKDEPGAGYSAPQIIRPMSVGSQPIPAAMLAGMPGFQASMAQLSGFVQPGAMPASAGPVMGTMSNSSFPLFMPTCDPASHVHQHQQHQHPQMGQLPTTSLQYE